MPYNFTFQLLFIGINTVRVGPRGRGGGKKQIISKRNLKGKKIQDSV
jgi:hypothetical protein